MINILTWNMSQLKSFISDQTMESLDDVLWVDMCFWEPRCVQQMYVFSKHICGILLKLFISLRFLETQVGARDYRAMELEP